MNMYITFTGDYKKVIELLNKSGQFKEPVKEEQFSQFNFELDMNGLHVHVWNELIKDEYLSDFDKLFESHYVTIKF